MRAVHVQTGPDDPAWTVRVEWVPRWRGWTRRVGGWRRKQRHDERPAVFDYSTDEEDRRQTRREGRRQARREFEAQLRGNGVDVDPGAGWQVEGLPDTDTDINPGADVADAASGLDAPDADSGWDFDLGDDLVFAVVLFVGTVITIGLAWWVLIPLALLVLDGLLLAVLLVLGVVARVALRRPWTVLATSSAGHRLVRSVVGWRSALRARDEMATALRRLDQS